VTIDRARFERSIEMIVRALHFHVFNERLLHPMRIHTTLVMDMESEVAEMQNAGVRKFCNGVHELIGDAAPIGDNPDVFWFKYRCRENSCGWHLSFYGGFDVYVLTSSRWASSSSSL